MFLLSGGSGLSALAVYYLAASRLTDERHRFRLIGFVLIALGPVIGRGDLWPDERWNDAVFAADKT